MPFTVGENVGPYRILEKLGQGGMATVFKAYHAALDRYVAIKALHPAFMEDPNFLKRFQREARVVARLEHPNIVPIYDFSEYEGRPYLVMKFIQGETLKAHMRDKKLPQKEIVRLLTAVGEALSYAHHQGILHRDVKPSNVLLAEDGRVYLADFGLARIAEVGESTLSSDRMLGTPQYISPEQAMGLGDLDEGTDIYSLGVMLYELVVGRVPFSADTPFSIIHDHIYTPLPLPHDVNPDVPENVERLLLKSLAKERADRFESVDDLVQAYRSTVSSEPDIDVFAPPEDSVKREEATFIASDSADGFNPFAETVIADESDIPVAETIAAPAEPVAKKSLSIPDVKEAVPPKKSRFRFRWWHIPIILLVLAGMVICGLLGLGAIIDLTDNGRIDPVQSTPVADPSEIEPLPSDQPTLDEALRGVEESPDDPNAHLNLAVAFWNAGEKGKAEEELWAALELAGDNMDIYLQAGRILAEREFWVESASVLLQGSLNTNTQLTGKAKDMFSEAAYKAAVYPEAENEIPIHEIALVNVPLENVVRARYYLYVNDNVGEAQQLVDEVLNIINPDMPEAILLQAEISFFSGDNQKGEELLHSLLGRDDIALWLRTEIESRIATNQQTLDQAIRTVEENPDDPWAHLDLFKTYLSLGKDKEAGDEIETIFALAPEDSQFFHDLGDVIAAEGAWQYAAGMYELAIRFDGEEPLPILLDKRDQAVYYGAVEPNGLETLLNTDLPLDPMLTDLAIARNSLHYVSIRDANDQISALVAEYPDVPMVRLLEAELYITSGENETAQAVLTDLLNQENIPDWVRQEASQMSQSINQ